MWSGRRDKAAGRTFLRGPDGIVALLAWAQDCGGAGREVSARLPVRCFALVTRKDVGAEPEEAAKLLAGHGSGDVAGAPGGLAWLARVGGDRPVQRSGQARCLTAPKPGGRGGVRWTIVPGAGLSTAGPRACAAAGGHGV